MTTRLAWSLFEAVFHPWMGARVRVHVTGIPATLPIDRPLVLCANHESFWDGFLLRSLQRRLRPDASFHAVMLRSELDRRPWLERLGAIGAEPGSLAGGRRMLKAVRALRALRGTAVLAYFPQGRIRPDGARPLGFRPGIEKVVEALAPATVLPVGLRILPGKTARMDAFLSVGAPLAVPGPEVVGAPLLEAAVGEELDAIRAFVALHGEDAAERWPHPRGRLPRGPDGSWIAHDVENWISRN